MIKSTLREIKTSITRYLAIFAIVALGVGFFSGLKDCKASMVSTADTYLQDHNFYDYRIISSYGIDDESILLAKNSDGVTGAEGSIQIDVIANTGEEGESTLKAISLPGDLNTLRLVEGRLPEAPDECICDNYTYTGSNFDIGGTIILTEANDKDKLEDFKVREFKIVGKVNTPIYLDYQRGTTNLGDGNMSTFFFIPEEAFDVDYYTDLYIELEGDETILSDELNEKLDSYKDSMEDLAERITDSRRNKEQGKAQRKLNDKKKEYEENLKKYEDEKADAYRKLDDAQREIDSGRKEISANEKKLNSTINDLKKKKKQVEDGLAEAKSGRSQLEKGLKGSQENKKKINAGITEAENKRKALKAEVNQQFDAAYEAKKAELDAALAGGAMTQEQYDQALAATKAEIDKQRNAKLAEVDAGIDATVNDLKSKLKEITDAEAKLKEVNSTIAMLEKNLKDINSGISRANSGKKTLESETKKVNDAEKELNSKRADADKEFADAEKELKEAKEKIDDAQHDINEMETGNSYAFSRRDNAGYSSFESNSDIVNNIAKIFPVFFFLIAALVCMTTMTRMIDEQRTQIGVLKALGYSNGAILAKYMFYSGSAALIGAVVGFLVGCKVFPAVIWDAYTMMYDFSDNVDYVIDPKLGILSLATAMICTMGATWASISADFRVAPSDLIRPKSPKAGKRILLERIKPVWNRLGFLRKVSMRNIFRDKKRFLMMVIGISGCTALLIAGMGIDTTISGVADYQFGEISLYDYQVIFSKNMTQDRRQDFVKYMNDGLGDEAGDIEFIHQGSTDLLYNGATIESTCVAADEEGFGNYINLHYHGAEVDFPGDGEAVIVTKINHDYGIEVGDEITIKDGFLEMRVRVSGICENYVGDFVFVSNDTYRAGFGKDAEVKSAYVTMYKKGSGGETQGKEISDEGLSEDEREAKIREASVFAANYDDVAAVSVNIDTKERVNKMMKSLNAVVYVVILSAGLLAFIVLYNLTNINITERQREIATIKVLGFYPIEVSQYVFRENLLLTAIAAAFGIPLGRWLLSFVINNIVVKFIYFEARLDKPDYIVAIILTFVFAFLVNLAMQIRLRAISMTESLKSIE